MARTESNMLELGTIAPEFILMDALSGKDTSLENIRGEQATLVMFICNHCPFVKHLEQGLRDLRGDYDDTKVGMVAINSNDVEAYPQDAPQYMAEKEYPFPYLFDESQDTAKSYQAACTPDFFLFDADLKLAYRGQFDAARPGSDTEITGADLRSAINALLAGERPDNDQKPSLGCNIKWRS